MWELEKAPAAQILVYEAGTAEQEHREQVDRYAFLKQQQTAYCNFIIANHPEESKLHSALYGCASYLFFRTFYEGDKSNVVASRLSGGFTCKKHLHCVCCATRRSARHSKTYEAAVRHLLKEHPWLVPVLITYTVKDGADLQERFAHLKNSQRCLLNYRRWVLSDKSTARGIDTVLRHVHGGAGGYEIKIGSGSGEWHPHIHEIALLDSREFVFTEEVVAIRKKHPDEPQRFKKIFVPKDFKHALIREWKAATGDSDQVDVRGLYPRDGYSRLQPLSEPLFSFISSLLVPDADAVFSGVCEAFKYALTPNDMTHEQQYHAAKVLFGSRLIYTYGSLRNVQVPDDSADDVEAELLSLPYYERVYQYYQHSESYYGYEHVADNEGENIMNPLPASVSSPHTMRKQPRKKKFTRFSEEEVKSWMNQFFTQIDDAPF
jgi:hypothetical protein